MRTTILVASIILHLQFAIGSDWDITFHAPRLPTYSQPVENQGVVVADVDPIWNGKETIVTTYTQVIVMQNDFPLTQHILEIPVIIHDYPGNDEPLYQETVAGTPAIGDIDSDGDLDIVVGISCHRVRDLGGFQTVLTFPSTIVWWLWDAEIDGFSAPHSYCPISQDLSFAFYGTPTICNTGLSEDYPTIAFFGPTQWDWLAGCGGFCQTNYRLSAFVLGDPDNIVRREMSWPEYFGQINGVAQSDLSIDNGPFHVRAADVDGDGSDELFANNFNQLGGFRWIDDEFGGNFTSIISINVDEGYGVPTNLGNNSMAIADQNGDGTLEIYVTLHNRENTPTLSQLAKIPIAGNSFLTLPQVGSAQYSTPILANLFGRSESPNNGTLNAIYQGDYNTFAFAKSTFLLLQDYNWPISRQISPCNIAVADVLGDAFPQIIDVRGSTGQEAEEIKVFDPQNVAASVYNIDLPLNPNDGIYERPANIVIEDYDGDGESELVVSYLRNNGGSHDLFVYGRELVNAPLNRQLIQWNQIGNGIDHKGLYAQPIGHHNEETVQPKGNMDWSGRIVIDGTFIVQHNQTLKLHPGTIVEFRPGARLWIDNGTLVANGTPFDSIYFVSAVPSEQWAEILVTSGNVNLDYAVVSDAGAGLNLSGVDYCLIKNSRIEDCNYGILSSLTGRIHVIGTNFSRCRASGVSINNGAVDFDFCKVSECGDGTFMRYGMTFFESSTALSCCEIFENTGPGIFSVDTRLSMSYDYSFRGGGVNHIHDNSWDRGELEFINGELAMREGGNFFNRNQAFSEVLIRNSSTNPQISNLTGNLWPSFVPNASFFLEHCVVPAQAFSCGPYSPTEFAGCNSLVAQQPIDASFTWNNALYQLSNSAPASARDSLKHLIREFDDTALALHASDLFVTASRLNEDALEAIIDTLEELKEYTSVPELQLKIREAQATALALADEADAARDSVFSILADVSSSKDSLSARLLLAEIDLFDYFMTSELPSTFNEEVSMYIARVDSIVGFYYEGVVFKPTMIWDDVSSLDKTEYSHTISTGAFTDDTVPVEFVFIDYRILPDQEWVHDTLTQQVNDTTWEITFDLDSLGGGLEYRLLAIDTLGRVETWPGTDGYPNLNDTLTHFVSFEPRLTVPLTDTAYVYAPGVITGDIEIGDGGVLYVLPAPVELDSYVVAIESGVGISLDGNGGVLPKLLVTGTDTTIIWLECADTGDRWSGVANDSGLVQIAEAELNEVNQPLSGSGVFRCEDVEFSDFALPLQFVETSASGTDSSYVIGGSISNGDSSGLIISDGSLDLENVTVENCNDDGVVLSGVEDQLLSNVRVIGNGRYGVMTESENTARLSNCYIAFNGDTLPEIKVNSNSTVDVSDYAGNIVKDSMGVLFECAEVNDFDAGVRIEQLCTGRQYGQVF